MYQEALENSTREVWQKFSFLKGFYLSGGTALALQIGHRISVDLDFFSPDPIKKTLLPRIEEVFKTLSSPLLKSKNETTLLIQGVKTTFLHYPFPLAYGNIPTEIVPLADAKDIASMKAYTIGRRQSFKDYVDLFAIFSKNIISLDAVISDAKQKYKEAFNDRLFLEQLVYTEDLEDEQIKWLINPVSKKDMRDFFKELVSEMVIL